MRGNAVHAPDTSLLSVEQVVPIKVPRFREPSRTEASPAVLLPRQSNSRRSFPTSGNASSGNVIDLVTIHVPTILASTGNMFHQYDC